MGQYYKEALDFVLDAIREGDFDNEYFIDGVHKRFREIDKEIVDTQTQLAAEKAARERAEKSFYQQQVDLDAARGACDLLRNDIRIGEQRATEAESELAEVKAFATAETALRVASYNRVAKLEAELAKVKEEAFVSGAQRDKLVEELREAKRDLKNAQRIINYGGSIT